MKRKLIVVLVLLILFSGWLWRVITLNKFWESRLREKETIIYQIGEVVPFEEDQLDKYSDLNGYSICVTDFQIIEYEDFKEQYGAPENEGSIELDRKVGLVFMTLSNTNNDSDGVTLTSFHLQSIDNLYMVDRELLEVVNPTLEKGAVGFRLPHDKSYDVVIPFRMLGRSYFGNWNNLDKVEMYLRVTSRIKEKLVKVQE